MVAFTGFTVQEGGFIPSTSNRITDSLDELSQWSWPPLPADYSARVINATAFTRVNNLLVAQEAFRSETGTGVVAASSFDVYYNTIHLLPSEVVLGNLLSNQTREIEVWNAYLSAQNLSSIDGIDVDGLSLTQPFVPPTNFTALESRTYILNISTSGPSIINGSFTFNFPTDTPILAVTGQRVIPFPFRPNWKRPVLERLEFKTDVMLNYDGSEQRIKSRQLPRISYEYTTTNLKTDAQRLKATLWDWQARVFALPIWQDSGTLQSSAVTDDLVLSINTDDLDYHVGGFVVLFSDTFNLELIEIASFTSTTVTLDNKLAGNWAAGVEVFPARLARLPSKIKLSNINTEMIDALVSFNVVNATVEAEADFALTYRGLPVLDRAPNSVNEISTQFKRDLDVLDNLTGVVTYDDRSDFAHTVQDYHWLLNSRADITVLRQWLHARKGRLVPFWSSSWMDDLEIVTQTGASITVIDIRYIGYASFMAQDIGRRDVKIILNDGTVFYRRITASIDNGNETETLTIDSSFGQTVEASDIHMISFMQIHRLDADAIELSWRKNDLVECSHMVKGLNYDV